MTSTLSTESEGVLVPFDSSMTLPIDSTLGEFYKAITSLTSFENETHLWEEYVKDTIPVLFGSVRLGTTRLKLRMQSFLKFLKKFI